MGLFKSKEEKRIERDIQIRKGINELKRNIKKMVVHERDYLVKARRAKRIGDQEQFVFLKRQLKRTAAQKKMRERQLLSLETAVQIKSQAEADVEFAQSMMGMSKAMSELYGSVDMAKIQQQFEKAMGQASSMRQRMDLFVELVQEQFSEEIEGEDEVVSDEEIDKLLEEEAAESEKAPDKEIEQGLKDLESELGK